jgi:HKD family nuclease
VRILNNIDSRHFDELKQFVAGSDELHIVSPFLMESFDIFFDEIIANSEIKRIVLVTKLKDNDPDLLRKANSLHSFLFNCLTNSIAFRVHEDSKLHGKIYIAHKNGVPIRGIITSANFTDNGLNQNHEWGVLVEDQEALKKLIADIGKVSSHALTREELQGIIENIDIYAKNEEVHKVPKFDLEVGHLFKKKTVELKPDVRYFIKPVGSSDRPFETTRKLNSDFEKMHFSRRPTPVRIGDILICNGVGTTKLLGYFEVISEPYIWDSTSQWSWELEVKNLCPEYSESWNTFNNTIGSIVASYDHVHPVTNVGGCTLGALQFGRGRIQLTEEFAKHVIELMEGSVKAKKENN